MAARVQLRMRRRNCLRLRKKPDRPGLESGGTCKFPAFPALTGCAHSDARRAALDREYLDGRGAPAQLYWSQRLNHKIAARLREAEQIGGDEQRTAGLLAIFLQPGGYYLSERSVRATLRALASYSAASASSLTVNWGSLTPTARRWQFMARSRSFLLSSIASLARRSLAILPLHYGSM